MVVIIVVGRFIGVLFTFYSFRLCFKKESLHLPQVLFICWGGMIRGAIAFALVIKLPYTCPGEDECLAEKYYQL